LTLKLAVGSASFVLGTRVPSSAGFELLDDKNVGHLSGRTLTRYLECYLTMLVAVSLLPMGKHQQLRLLSRNDVLQFGRPSKWCQVDSRSFALDENEPNVRKDEYTFEVLLAGIMIGI
jgi:hypothetical protein